MCGIGGFIDHSGVLDQSLLKRMQLTLQHRGPDDRGHILLTEGNARIGLSHTRLSILDLSGAAHQPMRFGPYILIYNGEIYNFREIRDDLIGRGHSFITDGDSEVILHAFAEWGMACLERFIGMFAFALYDSTSMQLYLVRDRAGIKPLYVHVGDKFWLFGSELKALMACDEFHPSLNRAALRAFFRHGYVPGDQCIFSRCHKVDAGTYWVVDTRNRRSKIVRWWNQTDLYAQDRIVMDFEESVDSLHDLLQSACSYRMVSDVPVGVFLSGGYDSTAVAAILQAGSNEAIKTFTIGFSEGNDEAPAARKIARILGTEHHELYCSPKESLEVLPHLSEIYDEPFADSSAIPTTLVSRLAREHVKVALSADGGDELFGGYSAYQASWRRIQRLQRIPPALRALAGRLFKLGAVTLPWSAHGTRHKLYSLSQAITQDNALMAQRLHGLSRLMPYSMVDALVPHDSDQYSDFEDRRWPKGIHPLDACMGFDYQTYLRDDILTKVDRATMSVGLEGREPLLDHRLAEFAARLPMQFKYDGAVGKQILRAIVHRYVPSSAMDRPKAGFSIPVLKWLRHELKPLADELLSSDELLETTALNSSAARKLYQEFQSGRMHYSPLIWRLFVFLSWNRHWKVGA